MPTSKLLYITSEASCPEYPENTDSEFVFRLSQHFHLIGQNKVLSVAFKGIYFPGKVIAPLDRDFIRVKLDLLDVQYSREGDDSTIAILDTPEQATYVESRHSKAVPIRRATISEIKVTITNEDGHVVSFDNSLGIPTIIKLEVTPMDAIRKAFTVTCSSASSDMDSSDETIQFNTIIPTPIHLKGRYRVGLTSVAIPRNIFCGREPTMMWIQAGYADKPTTVEVLEANIYLERCSSVRGLLLSLNASLVRAKIGLFVGLDTDTKEVFFQVQPLRYTKNVLKKSKKLKRLEDCVYITSKTVQMPQFKGNPPRLVQEQFIEPQLIFSWIKIKLSSNLTYIFNGQLQSHQFELDFFENRTHRIPTYRKPNYARGQPSALALHCPIVTETPFGHIKEHLLQIVPAHRSIENKKYGHYKVYHPEEITYHDVTEATLREIPIRITNLRGEPIHQQGHQIIYVVLHFIPL